MIDLTALATEIRSDPLALGYAPRVTAGDDAGVASLLDATTGPGSATIALGYVDRDAFLKAMRPAYLSLPGLTAAVQAKWDRILAAINTTDGITVDPTTQSLLSSAVTDGVLTQAQADAAWHRAGSRAEVLWGPGSTVSHLDVAHALRGTS